MANDPIELECSVTVPVLPDVAFERFVDEFSRWWPPEYTWSQSKLEWIGIDPRVGGRCTERSQDEFTVDFGRVLAVKRPDSLSIAWCIDPLRVPIPDVDRASLVVIDFASSSFEDTKVRLRHSKFERHGHHGSEYRDTMASEFGWPYILIEYAASFNS